MELIARFELATSSLPSALYQNQVVLRSVIKTKSDKKHDLIPLQEKRPQRKQNPLRPLFAIIKQLRIPSADYNQPILILNIYRIDTNPFVHQIINLLLNLVRPFFQRHSAVFIYMPMIFIVIIMLRKKLSFIRILIKHKTIICVQ